MVISGFDEGFLYVTFDIIEEGVIEVKKFGTCAGDSRQQAAGRGQQRMAINNQAINIDTNKCVNRD